jgi:hypothetical protein
MTAQGGAGRRVCGVGPGKGEGTQGRPMELAAGQPGQGINCTSTPPRRCSGSIRALLCTRCHLTFVSRSYSSAAGTEQEAGPAPHQLVGLLVGHYILRSSKYRLAQWGEREL